MEQEIIMNKEKKEETEFVLELEEEKDEPNFSAAEKIKKLKEELKQCRKEKSEYLAGWQRAKADFINARNEEEKERENFVKFAESRMIKELLALLDSFDSVLKNQKLVAKLDKDWHGGIKNMQSQLVKILKDHSVSVIETLGKKFNPEEQEAMENILVEEEAKNQMVIEEISAGYKLDDKVLRPAKVKVGIFKKQE